MRIRFSWPSGAVAFFVAVLTYMAPSVAKALDAGFFAEHAGQYIGFCVAINVLKKNHCPSIAPADIATCLADTSILVPPKRRPEYKEALDDFVENVNKKLPSQIDLGFKKTLSLTKGDVEKACVGYGTSLSTMRNQKLAMLRKLSGEIRW